MPAVSPLMVVVVPVPVLITASGLRVSVHVPEAGSPLIATLPVATVHVGWVIAPITGISGTDGTSLSGNIY